MFSGPRDNPYASKSASTGSWSLSTFSVLVVAVVFCVSLLLAYYLGLKAGKTSGLELAHENSLAQVLRMPVSRAVYDKKNEDLLKDKNSDIYKELSKTKAENNNSEKIEEPSKEVKEILKPTATASSAKNTEDQLAAILEPQPSVSVVKGKQENVDSIREALEQVNAVPTLNADLIPTLNDAVRVINPAADEATQILDRNQPEQASSVNNEDFNLKQEEKLVKPSATPTAKATIRVPPTVAAKNTPTPVKTVSTSLKKLTAGWYAQVAAPKSLKEAQALTSNLRQAGFKAQIEEAQVGDQQYYRVVVGPDNGRLAAEQNLARLRKQSALKAEPFVRLVR